MKFYSYLWLRDDGSPYYAGKGKGKRAFSAYHSFHPPADPSRILIFPHATEIESFESEIAFIKWFGRKDLGTGGLRNLTDGGEGSSGRIASQETRAKIGAKGRGRKQSPVAKRHQIAAQLGSTRSVETRAKQAAAAKGRKHSEATKAKLAIYRRGIKASSETKVKISLGQRRRQEQEFLRTVAWG